MASLVGQSLYILKHDENRRSLTAQRLDVDYDIQYVTKPSTSLDIGEGRIRVSSRLDNQWRTQSGERKLQTWLCERIYIASKIQDH